MRMDKRSSLRHTVISASAGSGKTYRLAHRYLALMAAGVHPDRIIAMTFSRKAAGEIFDAIIKYLCLAVGSAEAARRTAAEVGCSSLGSRDFLRILRELTDCLHRAHIGTLDSFSVSVIRAFPMELGVASDFQVMDNDGAEARSLRQQILQRIFSHPHTSESMRRNFLEAFKQATFGAEEKGLGRNLDRFVANHRSIYQAVPEQAAWGMPDRIWAKSPDWLTPEEGLGQAADELPDLLQNAGLPDKVIERWRVFCEAVRRFGFDAPWTRDIEYLFVKLAANLVAIRDGKASVRIDRFNCELDARECGLALGLVRHVMHTEVTRALTRTKGIFNILDQYEQIYDALARNRGRLTFDDVQFMLTESNLYSGGKVLSRCRGEQAKLYIDYRLDCQLDHWLLDEFQDTSDLQWAALQNLADEILQDDTGQRTFFYVGDVKQAIYGWRGGNARLFEDVRHQYGQRIVSELLDASYRSCPPVIETVNRVFENLPTDGLPESALRDWSGIWRRHTCATQLENVTGYATLLEPPCKGGSVKPTEEDRFLIVASLINELQPLDRGLSIAVLVRKNDSGHRIVDMLRRECEGLTVIHEGKTPIADNPVVALMLSLFKLAEHPGDMFARQHVLMTPLGAEFLELDRRGDASLELLRRIHADGFQGFVRHWSGRLDQALTLDGFGRLRLEQLIDAAGVFDGDGGGAIGDFLRFIENHDIRDLSTEGAVTVMTVHQSKGLGFDVVILPDLMQGSFDKARGVDLVARREPETNRPLWLLAMPRRLIAESDPELSQALRSCDEDACFESLCVLYVAVTRAKRGLYMVTSFPGKTATAVTAGSIVKTQLAGDAKPVDGAEVDIAGRSCTRLYEYGEREWYLDVPVIEKAPVPPDAGLPDDFAARPSLRARLMRVAPSMQDDTAHSAGWLFAGENREVLDFGGAIHELLESVEWVADADPEEIIAAWLPTSEVGDAVKRDVCDQFRKALSAEPVRRALSRPAGNVELWRERRFEIVLAGRWITGAFDRVVIERDGAGAPLSAVIVDYKSNRIGDESQFATTAENYRPQLELYGKALSRMLRIPHTAIGLRILFTRAARVFDL